VVGDQQLIQFIASVPSLQDNGKFSKERYEALVAAQGMSKEMFEARVRQDIAVQQLALPVTEAGIVGTVASGRWAATQIERREISELQLVPDNFTAKVKLAADAVQKYYEANRKLFELPEQVRAEYLVLSRDALAAQAAIGDEDIKAYYKTHDARFKEAESRRASHILIRADKNAPEAEANAAKAKAEELLGQVRKAPADFAKLAKQHSQDPGSAAKGGDLDWFGRGAMVKAFEDTVFALKDGQVSDVVRSDFGFHVIRVTGIRPERIKSIDDVKAEIVAELRREIGTKKYAEAAEAFGNMVYEQSDSLKPAAEKWKLEVRQTSVDCQGWQACAEFRQPETVGRAVQRRCAEEQAQHRSGRSRAGMLVAARVLEHKPAALQPMESVRAEIEKRLIREEAASLAIKDGEEKLARLTKGEAVDREVVAEPQRESEPGSGTAARVDPGDICDGNREACRPMLASPIPAAGMRCIASLQSRRGKAARMIRQRARYPRSMPA
jgi:peptidyl-prolyl cis-trans isomerase D